MTLMRRFTVPALALVLSACGSTPPTTPTPPPTATPTRIINVSGDLSFGNVNIGESPTRTFVIGNSGSATLTYTSLSAVGGTGTAGVSATPLSGSIQAGGALTVSVRFAPTLAQAYSNTLTVVGDQTSGNNTIGVSGRGINNTPPFAREGMGDTVFDIPSTITRLQIYADYGGNSSNFIVWLGPIGSSCSVGGGTGCRLLVNELLGRSWSTTHYQGQVQTGGGGTLSVSKSSGVAWSFSEIR